jgi:hypothetical protein
LGRGCSRSHGPVIKATAMREQLNLFGAAVLSNDNTIEAISSIEASANSVIGILVGLELDIKCSHSKCRKIAVIGSSSAIHYGSLRCEQCGKHLGWLSKQSYDFIAETQRLFGRPTDPILVRKPNG